MKRSLIILAVLIAITTAGVQPVAAQNRYIVRTTGGLTSVLKLCLAANCQVQGAIDGNVGQTYLVTSTGNLIANLLNGVVNLLESLLGIKSVEPDQLLPIPLKPVNSIPPGLNDRTPVNYYGTPVWHGYAAQPAAQIIRLSDAQNGFNIGGTGIVAVIDTGVDTSHPVLQPVLLPGYDFTRNQPGASELLDVPQLQSGANDNDSDDPSPAFVQQSSVAVLDQSSVAVLDGGPYSAFGHGTMTTGLVHLVAPKSKILPLKAFTSNGSGYLSNIVAALYYAVQHQANVVNMSFDVSASSAALNQAVSYATQKGVVLVAAAGNENTSAPVYPAALNGNVMGIASTTNWDARSSFSNYGNTDVWIAAPGEYVITTFPGGTYASASGTSFSSPMVAGTVALMLNAKPSQNQSSNQSSASSALSHAIKLTPDLHNGRLDAYQAVSAWINSNSSSGGGGSCFLFCL
ncbi:MAG TPA: S8 family serine peptidase [Candidatus Acidoferrum sp.]|nr:S8 family serine peptidase [Candidatus Acidoferrum sp.]